MTKPKTGKKAFPMGYQPPKAEAYPRTGSGQKQSGKQRSDKMKAALKATMSGAYPKQPKRPIRKKK